MLVAAFMWAHPALGATSPIAAGSLGNATNLSGVEAVAVSGAFAYTAGYNGGVLNVVDISNPASPQVVGQTVAANALLNATNITISGPYAYVVSKNRNGPSGSGSNDDGTGNSLTIVDISNPAAPSIVGSLHDSTNLFGAYGIAIAGMYAYVAAQGCLVNQPCPKASVGDDFAVVDVFNPSNPTLVATIHNQSLPPQWTGALKHATSVALMGDDAFVAAAYSNELTAIDVSDPTHPVIAGTVIDNTQLDFPVDVAASNGYAFVADQATGVGRVAAVDVHDPSMMQVASSVTNRTWLNGAYRIHLRNDFAYVAGFNASTLAAVDISDPTQLRFVGGFKSTALLNRTTGVDVDSTSQYAVTTSPFLSTEISRIYPPFPLQPGGPAQTGTLGTITLDPVPVGATITPSSEPPVSTTQTSVAFGFTLTDAVSTPRCSLDQSEFALCTSAATQSYSALPPGQHTFTVEAIDAAGRTAAASFSWTITAPQPPTNTGLPVITGQPVQGALLFVTPGTWTGTPTPTLTYQWNRCDQTGNNCTPITGATTTTYTPTSTDIGSTLTATVTATNTAGTLPATTTPTAVIAAVSALAPTTPVLDGFNRANGAAGANWSLIRSSGFAAMKVSNNAAVDSSTSQFAWNYWNPSTFGPDSEAYATITAWGASDVVRIGARVTGAGTNNYSGYFVAVSATGVWSILRIDNATVTTLATGPTQLLAAGDQLAIRIVGATITALHYTPTGGWTQVLTYDTSADTTRYTNPGYLAIEFKTSTIDNFGGGSIPASPANQTPPAITGTATVGQQLTLTPGTWTGTPTPTLTYQWNRCDQTGNNCTPITGATTTTYTPTSTDIGSTLTATVTATNTAGTLPATTTPTAVIAATTTPPANQTPPAITGTATVGQQLTLTPGTWTGTPTPTLTYQWNRCDQTGNNCTPITGATTTTYTPTSTDIGSTLTATVTATNTAGTLPATTTPTAVIAATTTPPANQTPPAITGTATVGQQLTLTPGTWTGTPTPTLTYQWNRCDQTGNNCTPITGATTTTYTPTSTDIGSTLTATVTATNTAGTLPATTTPTAVIAATTTPPANQTPPAITGTATVGQQLTLTPGTWTGTPTPTLTYQWNRCDQTGNNCTPITGATTTTYTPTSTDIGSTLTATVTATNTAGTLPATTTPTAVIAAVSALAPTTPVLDGFNRANGAAGANWSLIRSSGFAAMKVSNNAAVDSSTSQFAWNYWNPSTFGPDSEAYATITAWGASDVVRIGARVTGAGTNNYSGYFVAVSATGVWSILRIDNATVTTLATGPTQLLAAGDQLAIRIVGATITALHYTPTGGWTQVLTYDTSADTTRYTNPGYLAIEFKTSTIDNFGGGSIPASPANQTPPAITGTATVGQQLTLTPGTWTGTPTPTLTYQWNRCDQTGNNCTPITGATTTTYTPTSTDIGSTLTATVTATNTAGTLPATTTPTAVIAATTTPPANQTPPAITGTATVGQQLTLTPGTWTGTPTPTLTYQWNRCDQTGNNCTPITGATTTTYTPTSTDIGSTLTATVTATNTAGTLPATTTPTAVIAATTTPPANQTPPAITGTATVGQQLTLTPGTWTGTPTPTLTYQWNRCDQTGNNCTPITGATTTTYTPTSTDIGSTLTATVTATNTAGTLPATTTPTAVIAAVSALAPTTPVLDGFNRANGAAGANWSLIRSSGFAAMKVSNNAAVDSSTSQFAWNYWNPSTFGPDSEAYATITAWGASDVVRIGARVTGAGTNNYSGYFVAVSATGVWSILRIDNATVTTLATGPTQLLAAGDQLAIRIVGATITALHYTPTGGWTQVLTYDTSADTTRYTNPGYLAIEFKTSTIDNFGGGSIPASPANQTPPAITGTATVGQQLTLTPGTWTGTPTPTLTYQWNRCDQTGNNCTPITGATTTTYTPTSTDIGSTLTATVTATNTAGTLPATTTPTAVIAATTTPPANQTPPAITGTATVGQQLTLTPGTWTGTPTPTLTYQWNRCDQTGNNCTPITGATTTTYTPTSTDIGSTLTATVTATNTAGTLPATTTPTAVIAATTTPPANQTPPAITGTATVGQQLTLTPGTWTGTPTPTLTYQWNRCDQTGNNCTPITGATTTTYTPTSTDIGSTLTATVTATNTAGTLPATTTPTAVIAAVSALAPTTPVLDGFNRANGAAGANWSLIRSSGFAAMKVSNNAAVDSSTSQFAWNYWNPSTFGPDSEAYATITAWGASDVVRIGARVTGAGTNNYSGYFVAVSATGVWSILRIDNATVTTLATGPTQLLAAGDQLAIRIVGATITALHYTPTGGWTQVLTYDTSADTTRYTNPGYLAIEFKTSTIDNFGGGSIPASPANQTPPAITGTATVGQQLTLTPGTWTGTPTPTLTYQWNRCDQTGNNCTPITGATTTTYTPTSTDIGSTLTATVTATNTAGTLPATTTPTAVIAATTTPPANQTPPAITGTATVGQQLTLTPGTWTGTPTPTLTYQWNRCDQTGNNCTPITGATTTTYTPTSTDIGSTLTATVTATNTAGTLPATTTPTAVIAATTTPPANQTPPAITGTATVGQQLTLTPGTWTGTPTPTLTYQWNRCDQTGNNCTPITGATTTTYTPTSTDIGSTLTATVTATNTAGTLPATTTPTAVIAATTTPPANQTPPAITGTATVGQQLTLTPGTWTGTPTPTLTYQWNRCDQTGNNCTPITGATTTTYTPTSTDIGSTLTATVTATNTAGTLPATTTPTATIE